MTKDKILVEREYDGKLCSESCPHFEHRHPSCRLYDCGVEMDEDTYDCTRCPACLSTPGVEVK